MDAGHKGKLMPVLVDTNVIVDVLTNDPEWADWSVGQLETRSSGGLVINPVIYAELCFGAPSASFVDDVVKQFALVYQEIPRQGLYRAAKAFARYKKKKGTKSSVLPDFFIGGHAEAANLDLLTRDTKRLGAYFPGVTLICPTKEG
ncbi:MAG: type II toxin-antitoxin system VapC family toxin [Chthoniobacterales bacterium]